MSEADSSSPSSIPITSSKLVPAAAPTISAWGKKLEVATPAPANGIKKDEWPTVDVVLAKDVPLAPKDTVKENIKPVAPKVKSTGKEKWVPYEATIILPGANGNGNSNKKKSNNSNSNSNNKKKGQNQNGQSGNGKKKDGQKNNQSTQKKQNDGSSGKKNDKKAKESGESKPSDAMNAVTEGVAAVNIKATPPTILSSSVTPSPQPDKATPTAQESTEPAKGLQSQAADLSSSTAEATAANTTESSAATSVTSPASTNTGLEKQQSQHPQQPFNKRNQNQHRNSEPFTGNNNNGNFYNNSNNRRGRGSNMKQFNGRHSVGGYPQMPYMANYPYGYNMLPPGQFAYQPQPFYQKAPVSRSNSQSPHKGEFAALSLPQQPLPVIPPFVPQQFMYNPYEVDQATLTSKQLAYYFSPENLIKDIYLRKQMNSQGYVPLSKLLQFNRLKSITNNDAGVLLRGAKLTPTIELKNDKVRAVENWSNWVLPYDQRDETGKVEEDVDENKGGVETEDKK